MAEIDADVTAGNLTQAEADARKADLTTRIQAMVDGTALPGGFGGGRGPDGPGPRTGTGTAPAASGTGTSN